LPEIGFCYTKYNLDVEVEYDVEFIVAIAMIF